MSKSVLITGGAGYLGGRIASTLASTSKWAVRLGTHRQPDALPPWTRQYDVVSVDVCTEKGLQQAFAGMDAIVHLAALNEVESAEDPERALTVNTLGTLRMLTAAQAVGVKRFLYISTAHVYGAPLVGFIDEKIPARPVHPYAITHRAAEDFVLAAHGRNLIEGLVVRLSNGFGAPADSFVNRWTLLVNELCRQAVTEGRLVLRSSGMQRRDFITLLDVGRAIEHLLEVSVASLGDGLFNLGGRNPMRVSDMAELIADRCKAIINVRPQIVRPAEPTCEETAPLDYSIAKLETTGFSLQGDPIAEIDATLRLCENVLGRVHS